MNRIFCFAFVMVGLAACGGAEVDSVAFPPPQCGCPARRIDAGVTATVDTGPTCEQLAATASDQLQAAITSSGACNVDADCQNVPDSTSCVGGCGALIGTSSLNAYQSARAKVESTQCAAMKSLGCAVQAPYCPYAPSVSMCLLNQCTVVRGTLKTQPDGTATGDGATCTFGPAYSVDEPATFIVGATSLSPNRCQQCTCTTKGFLCDGSCPAGAPLACDSWTRVCPDNTLVSPQLPDCAAPACQ